MIDKNCNCDKTNQCNHVERPINDQMSAKWSVAHTEAEMLHFM